MARYIPANAPYPRSSEYIATSGLGAAELTEDQKKMLKYGAIGALAFFAWKKLKKKK